MLKIVFDANVVISAGLKPGSAPALAILLARSYATIVISDSVEAEIRSVIERPKFAVFRESLDLVLNAIVALAERYQPTEVITDCRDAKDNKYLELAIAAEAALVVSGDDDLLSLHPWRTIDIIGAAEAVRRLTIAAAPPRE